MEDRMMTFPEPEHIEASIYSGGFPSQKDKDLMQEFHLSEDINHLIKISRNFEDERFSIFAERIICSQYGLDVPEDVKSRYMELIKERATSDGKWGSVQKSVGEIDVMLEDETSPEKIEILDVTKKKLLSMRQNIE